MFWPLFLVGLAGAPTLDRIATEEAESGSGTYVSMENEELVYRGPITVAGADHVVALLKQFPDTRSIAIESVGGDIEAGMRIGEMVRDNRMNVRVIGTLCMSSCANYVFLAGREKRIDPGAVVVWHGSAIQEGLWELDDLSAFEAQKGGPLSWWERRQLRVALKRYGERMKARQQALYASLGIDARITVFGQLVGCHCNWTLTVSDMERFGVSGVHAETDYGQQVPNGSEVDWRLLRLSDHPSFPLMSSR